MTSRPPRGIDVDGVGYRWSVRFLDSGHVMLRAWLDGPHRRRQLAVSIAFDDYWLNFGEIIATPPEQAADRFNTAPLTPALVAHLIHAALASDWHPETTGAPAHFTLGRDRSTLTACPAPSTQPDPSGPERTRLTSLAP